MSEPLVSVVVPFRDGAQTLPQLFAALEAQTLPSHSFEVVLVDDASTDESRTVAAAWAAGDPAHRCVLAGLGKGPASARNVGIAHAHGGWIAFTDADVVPDPRWLEALLAAGASAEAVEGRVVAWPPDEIRANTHYVSNEHGGLYVTANIAYRRRLLERLGGFDERFGSAFLEDSDLAFRVLDLGIDIPFAADALVRHGLVEFRPTHALRAARKLSWLPLLAAKHPQRYASEIRPLIRPLTRPDVHVLAGLAGLSLLLVGGALRIAGALLAANAVRVVARDPRLTGPPRQMPVQAAVAVALPVVKAGWWLVGRIKAGSVSPS